jgi:hypothetical protein
MKYRCIYCTHVYEADALPPACPSCATPLSLTVTPETTLFDLAMAVDRNGHELAFDLERRPTAIPTGPRPMDFALACAPEHDTQPRPPGCDCHLDHGDSPCPAHGDDDK